MKYSWKGRGRVPLDHYVSQVHLKNFYSPKLKNRMYAIRKQDLTKFNPKSEDVCRTDGGSTNPYLQSERAIEEFLRGIEPKYNTTLVKLESGQIDRESIYVIAGFVAYVSTCSPAGMRLKAEYLKEVVEEFTKIADRQGIVPVPPPELAGEYLTDLIMGGKVNVEIDLKYPQAIGISSILKHTSLLGNFCWEIIINPYKDSPFFTSDFPVAIEKSGDPRIHYRVIPLSPNLAVRIKPDPTVREKPADFKFSNFHYRIIRPSRAMVTNVNRLIVRCAESLVFYRDDYDWIPKFVRKNAAFRIESIMQKVPTQDDGTLIWVSEEVVQTEK
jgi:hypothetical protein